MAIIQLTKDQVTLVDDNLFEELNRFKWYCSGLFPHYRPARRVAEHGKKLTFLYHQVLGIFAWELRPAGLVVDHINRNTLDNRLENLRIVSQSENMKNSSTHENARGVSYDKTHGTWKAYYGSGPSRVNLGTFQTEQGALLAVALARP